MGAKGSQAAASFRPVQRSIVNELHSAVHSSIMICAGVTGPIWPLVGNPRIPLSPPQPATGQIVPFALATKSIKVFKDSPVLFRHGEVQKYLLQNYIANFAI